MKWSALGGAVLACLLLGILLIERRRGLADIGGRQTRARLDVRSSGFVDGGWMPSRLTCLGENLSPALEYFHSPANTRSLAIVMLDLDSPIGFTHWLVYDIPGEVHVIAEGASSQRKLPRGVKEGLNSWDKDGYASPCPPRGKHRYEVRIYALDLQPNLPPGMTKQQLASALKGHVLAEGQMIGLYEEQRSGGK